MQTKPGEIGRAEIETRISSTLHLLGIPAHIRGHRYLRDAIAMAIENPEAAALITKYIYPDIARLHQTTPACVAHAMLHAIQISWERGQGSPVFAAIFSKKASRPKNLEFLNEVSQYVLHAIRTKERI